jgi:hypothetical protein
MKISIIVIMTALPVSLIGSAVKNYMKKESVFYLIKVDEVWMIDGHIVV